MMLSKLSISEQTKMRAPMHLNLNVHDCYQKLINKNLGRKQTAMNPLFCMSRPSSLPGDQFDIKPNKNRIVPKNLYFAQNMYPSSPRPPINFFPSPQTNPNQIGINISAPSANPLHPSHQTHQINLNYPSTGSNFVTPQLDHSPPAVNHSIKSF